LLVTDDVFVRGGALFVSAGSRVSGGLPVALTRHVVAFWTRRSVSEGGSADWETVQTPHAFLSRAALWPESSAALWSPTCRRCCLSTPEKAAPHC